MTDRKIPKVFRHNPQAGDVITVEQLHVESRHLTSVIIEDRYNAGELAIVCPYPRKGSA